MVLVLKLFKVCGSHFNTIHTTQFNVVQFASINTLEASKPKCFSTIPKCIWNRSDIIIVI